MLAGPQARVGGVRLSAVSEGSRPDPGQLFVKDGRARYYSTNADGWGRVISVWNSDGSYLSSFGRRGDGPGEFAGNRLALFIDDGDSLHVKDVSNRSVFSPDHIIRSAGAGWTGGTLTNTTR